MQALEFEAKIKNNRIEIPLIMQSRLKAEQDKNVRVIVLIGDNEVYDDLIFRQTANRQFLNGYAESDSIYDND
jgi:hypothetical protein